MKIILLAVLPLTLLLPLPLAEAEYTTSSCTLPEGVYTCTFICQPGQHLRASAVATRPGNYPSVIAECSGAKAECQSGDRCSAMSTSQTSGYAQGTCRIRTVYTTATCSAISSYGSNLPERIVYEEQIPVERMDIPPSPVGTPLAVLNTYDCGVSLCVDLTPEGGSPIPLVTVNREFLGPADALVPRGEQPLGQISAGELGQVPASTFTLTAGYFHDPGKVTFVVGALGLVEAHLPCSPAEVPWYLSSGESLAFYVRLRSSPENGLEQEFAVSLPWVGQALAAAAASA